MLKHWKDKVKGHKKPESSSSLPSNPYFSSPQQQQHSTTPTGKYQSPPGAPPEYDSSEPEYASPSSPSQNQASTDASLAPPAGLPPSQHQYPQQPAPTWDPPPYHDWTIIPDTALLPPPPSIGYNKSPTANATPEEGDRALNWTNDNPLWSPYHLTDATHDAIQNAQLALLKAPTYIGELIPQPKAGHWRCRTYSGCRDACIMTNLPMYSVFKDSPLTTRNSKTIYFELKVMGIGRRGSSYGQEADAGIAIGFSAPPYPTFRLPGWERASLAVHSDDGRKYVNDAWGGKDFTTAFVPGEIVGIGITFSIPKSPPSYEQQQQQQIQALDISVFFTRNGRKEGVWDGNEELDARSEGGNTGLRGECDLFPAIGVFGCVDFEVFFHPTQWMYTP